MKIHLNEEYAVDFDTMQIFSSRSGVEDSWKIRFTDDHFEFLRSVESGPSHHIQEYWHQLFNTSSSKYEKLLELYKNWLADNVLLGPCG